MPYPKMSDVEKSIMAVIARGGEDAVDMSIKDMQMETQIGMMRLERNGYVHLTRYRVAEATDHEKFMRANDAIQQGFISGYYRAAYGSDVTRQVNYLKPDTMRIMLTTQGKNICAVLREDPKFMDAVS